MKLGLKLNLMLAIILSLLIISLLVNRNSLEQINDNYNELIDEQLMQYKIIESMRYELAMQGLYARAVILDNDTENKELVQEYASSLDNSIHELEPYISGKTKVYSSI